MRRITQVLLIAALLCGCAGQAAAGPTGRSGVWIDAPLSGARVAPGTAVVVTAYASGASDVTQMTLLVGGSSAGVLAVDQVSERLFRGQGVWTPSAAGSYWLRVEMATADGGSAISDAVLLQVAEATPIPPTTAAPEPVVLLTADATSLTAGACTFLRWQVRNVEAQSIDLNGVPVGPEGAQEVCLCESITYDLIVLAGGEKYSQSVAIAVSGTCVTPTTPAPPTTQAPPTTTQPPPDTTPPPIPSPLGPGSTDPNNPPDVDCPVTLRWQAVSDPSGVTYSVGLEKQIAPGNWSQVGSWDNLTVTERPLSGLLLCDYGWTYRWRVRARDGAGNWSSWSAWLAYEVPIS